MGIEGVCISYEEQRSCFYFLIFTIKAGQLGKIGEWENYTFLGVNIPLNKEGSVTNMCKAWEDQRKEDLENGRIREIFLSVQEGDYGIRRGAEKLGISEAEFERRMIEAGFGVRV